MSTSSGSWRELAAMGLFLAALIWPHQEGGAVRISVQYLCFAAVLLALATLLGKPEASAASRRRLVLVAITSLVGAVFLD